MSSLDELNSINAYISMTRNYTNQTAGKTSLHFLQIPSNGFENCIDILLGQNASMKQHLHTNDYNNDKTNSLSSLLLASASAASSAMKNASADTVKKK